MSTSGAEDILAEIVEALRCRQYAWDRTLVAAPEQEATALTMLEALGYEGVRILGHSVVPPGTFYMLNDDALDAAIEITEMDWGLSIDQERRALLVDVVARGAVKVENISITIGSSS